MQSGLKFEAGKVVITLSEGVDADKDGAKSVEGDIVLRIDLLESMNEAFKVDPTWFAEAIRKFEIGA